MKGLQLSDDDFRRLSLFVHRECGINLHEGKRELIRARLSKRIRLLNLSGFGAYYNYLVNDLSGVERREMLNAISTNLTSFFREPRHFIFMRDVFFPEFLRQKERDLNIWSSGCSTGEEPYSIAICCLEAIGAAPYPLCRILATDISTDVLEKADAGIYPESNVRHLGAPIIKKYFKKGVNCWTGRVKVKENLRRMIEFNYLNLIDACPFENQFHIIFCRNVMIYFQKKMQEQLVQSYFRALRKGGYLFIGHSETLMGKDHAFSYIMPTIYRKPCNRAGGRHEK